MDDDRDNINEQEIYNESSLSDDDLETLMFAVKYPETYEAIKRSGWI